MSYNPHVEVPKQNLFKDECVYEPNMLFEAICRISNGNYAGNPSLLWGKIKL